MPPRKHMTLLILTFVVSKQKHSYLPVWFQFSLINLTLKILRKIDRTVFTSAKKMNFDFYVLPIRNRNRIWYFREIIKAGTNCRDPGPNFDIVTYIRSLYRSLDTRYKIQETLFSVGYSATNNMSYKSYFPT